MGSVPATTEIDRSPLRVTPDEATRCRRDQRTRVGASAPRSAQTSTTRSRAHVGVDGLKVVISGDAICQMLP
jgi:hypothetical protein